MMDWATIDAGLTGPDFFVGEEFHEAFRTLRYHDPVHLTEDHHYGGRNFWSLSRYADCAAVLADPELFSSQAGSQLPPHGPPATPEYLHRIGADQRLTRQDPPFHTQVRRPLNPHFSVPATKRYRAGVEAIVDSLLADLDEGDHVDLVADVCAPMPMRVTFELMDIPQEHWDEVRDHATSIINPGDPQRARGREARDVQADGFAALNEYLHADLRERRAHPRDDFASTLAGLTVAGEQLSERYVSWMATTIVAAGLESTRDAASLGLRELIRNPEQADLLREDPRRIGTAVEEVIRYVTPSRNRLRVATADTVIGGRQIRAGDWVVCWLTSANRDPEVFERPDQFDITRTHNPHLGFSAGMHICLGRNLSRIELEVLFLAFLGKFPASHELAPGPTWIGHNNGVAGLASYPVALATSSTSVAAS